MEYFPVFDEVEMSLPNLTKKEYIPLWDKRNPIWSVDYRWIGQ
jgi:hypothetical protein